MPEQQLKVYFAGDLFNAKDLGGNALLANAIEKRSNHRYKIMLPQDGECEVCDRTSQSIRDADFELLYNCDLITANFDGTDLDSGTVVEFCFAKMVDMPAVLLRTDFRNSGDHTLPDGEPWNLMCSHFPRTNVLHINGMVQYHNCKNSAASLAELLENFYNSVADGVIAALDDVARQPSWLKKEQLLSQYQTAIKSIGGSLGTLLNDDTLKNISESKAQSGLYD